MKTPYERLALALNHVDAQEMRDMGRDALAELRAALMGLTANYERDTQTEWKA